MDEQDDEEQQNVNSPTVFKHSSLHKSKSSGDDDHQENKQVFHGDSLSTLRDLLTQKSPITMDFSKSTEDDLKINRTGKKSSSSLSSSNPSKCQSTHHSNESSPDVPKKTLKISGIDIDIPAKSKSYSKYIEFHNRIDRLLYENNRILSSAPGTSVTSPPVCPNVDVRKAGIVEQSKSKNLIDALTLKNEFRGVEDVKITNVTSLSNREAIKDLFTFSDTAKNLIGTLHKVNNKNIRNGGAVKEEGTPITLSNSPECDNTFSKLKTTQTIKVEKLIEPQPSAFCVLPDIYNDNSSDEDDSEENYDGNDDVYKSNNEDDVEDKLKMTINLPLTVPEQQVRIKEEIIDDPSEPVCIQNSVSNPVVNKQSTTLVSFNTMETKPDVPFGPPSDEEIRQRLDRIINENSNLLYLNPRSPPTKRRKYKGVWLE